MNCITDDREEEEEETEKESKERRREEETATQGLSPFSIHTHSLSFS
jgi:hypothetical protein